MNQTLKLPIGIDDFREIRREGFYYVDKTDLITELMNNHGKVNLFTRPRRFGKTLNMSMLQRFFELDCEKTLFDGLAVAREPELCEQHMGKYPVIFLTLKDVDGRDFAFARGMLHVVMQNLADNFLYLLDSDRLTDASKEHLKGMFAKGISDQDLLSFPVRLSHMLHRHHGQQVVLLIDEYDVPLDKAFHAGYYGEMVSMIRTMFSQALKSNPSLYMAVLTGCLRISKESIFTGLNNFKVLSITDVRYNEYFGFSDEEVRKMLEYYGRSDRYPDARAWYDGYRFGQVEVYCPWDVINYCDLIRADPGARPQSYWIHSSSNSIVKRFIQKADRRTRKEIEDLIAGRSILKEIHQELTYSELDSSIDHLWSVLFTTGYLTYTEQLEDGRCRLRIPNREICDIFVRQIQEWFRENTRKNPIQLQKFCDALRNGDAASVEAQFNTYLSQTISIRDTFVRKAKKENFYHGILLGILSCNGDWYVSSSAETGKGYSDIQVLLEDDRSGILIELKYAEHDTLDAACRETRKQIEDQAYAESMKASGVTSIQAYGIACYQKHCKVIGWKIS